MLIKNNGLIKRALSIFLAVCMTVALMNGMSIKPEAKQFITDDAASGYNAEMKTDKNGEKYLTFKSGTQAVSSGLVVTQLGYFCTAYDVTGETTGTPITITHGGVTQTIKGSVIGTVFLYQTDDDSNPDDNFRTNIVSNRVFYTEEKETKIPLEYIDEKFKYEYGEYSHEYINYKNVESKGNLVYVLDTLLTVGYKSGDETFSCIRLNERDNNTLSSGYALTKDIMLNELSDYYSALNYDGANGAFYSHQELYYGGPFIGDLGIDFKYSEDRYRYIMISREGFDAIYNGTNSSSFFNNAWEDRQAVLYVSSDFVMTNTSSNATTVFNKYPAAIRCGVVPTFSQFLHDAYPRLNPYYKNDATASVVSSVFGSETAQPRIVNGFFAIGIGNGLLAPADVEALTPTFHKTENGSQITSPKEGEPLYIKYHFKNNGETDVSCTISGVFSTDGILTKGGFSERIVTIGAGETYTEVVGPITLDRFDFGSDRDEYWFYKKGTKEAYNVLFEVAATGRISLADNNLSDNDTSDNVASRKYAIHIKAPSVTTNVTSQVGMGGHPSITTKMYSGQPIKPIVSFKNNSSFSGLFTECVQMFFGGNLINNFNYTNNRTNYVTAGGAWMYNTNDGFYRPKFTDSTSTSTIKIVGSAYEQSAYEFWGTRGWSQNTHVGSDSKEITVYPADLEAVDIKILDANTLTECEEVHKGQNIVVDYTFCNNTELPVYIKTLGSTDDVGNLNAFNAEMILPAKTITTLRGEVFTVSTQNTTLTASGAIYMADLWGDASYEYNQTNNTASKTVPVVTPFKPEAAGGLTQDSVSYRRGTDVYTSFKVTNTTYNDVSTPMPTASITVYGDSALTDIIYEEDVPFCAPAGETTMAWIKWTVPYNCPDTVYIEIICDKDNIYSGEVFLDNGENSKRLLVTVNVNMPLDVSTPDTTFVKEAPYWYKSASDFSVSDNSSLMADVDDFINSSSWYYWQYKNGQFTKNTQSASITSANAYIEPIGNTSAFLDNANKWNMKSGYGYTLSANVNIDGTKNATDTQSAYCIFPEFAYRTASTSIADKYGNYIGHYVDNNTAPTGFDSIRDSSGHPLYPKCGGVYGTFSSLDIEDNTLSFRMNDSTDAPVHFTPIWYPDKEYKVYIYISDIWTPGGMISGFIESNTINIEGNMYDDYYVMEY